MEGVSGQRMQAGEQAVRGGGGGRPFLDLNLNRSKVRPPENLAVMAAVAVVVAARATLVAMVVAGPRTRP